MPRKPGLYTRECLAVLREALPPLAATAWDDLTSTDGQLRFDHDVYLKLWQLSGPRLPADYLFLDEAQDANPVIASIVEDPGRDRPCRRPRGQIPASGTTALGSCLGCGRRTERSAKDA